jgi:ubiquitin thioesterase OTU1
MEHPKKPSKHAAESPEDVVVSWPSREGILRTGLSLSQTMILANSSTVLRVMPSDNSCLFTAFGGALSQQITASQLRKMVAEYITAHPVEYPEVILAMPPAKYCRNIQGKDHWGGAIELGIFSDMFDIEICAFDVKVRS